MIGDLDLDRLLSAALGDLPVTVLEELPAVARLLTIALASGADGLGGEVASSPVTVLP